MSAPVSLTHCGKSHSCMIPVTLLILIQTPPLNLVEIVTILGYYSCDYVRLNGSLLWLKKRKSEEHVQIGLKLKISVLWISFGAAWPGTLGNLRSWKQSLAHRRQLNGDLVLIVGRKWILSTANEIWGGFWVQNENNSSAQHWFQPSESLNRDLNCDVLKLLTYRTVR